MENSAIGQPLEPVHITGMFIIGVGTASPGTRYSQRECWDALQQSGQFQQLSSRSRALLRKVLLSDNGIETRSLALSSLAEAFQLEPNALHARFQTNAPGLAASAAANALEAAGLRPDEVDAVLISTCTGYLCPGLTSYVSERLGLRPSVQAFDLVGQGCGAALPNLQLAHSLLHSNRCQTVLSICVEVCSAAFYLDDDPGVLISACLFGDGAAAVVTRRDALANRRGVEWLRGESLLDPAQRDLLRFEQRDGMLRNVLTLRVPQLAAQKVRSLLGSTLEQAGKNMEDVTGWILHAGGRDVLHALKESLGRTEEDLRWSAAVLREHGNVSSPSVWFALERALRGEAPGGLWWMASFGAGFSCHGALLHVE